MQNASLWCLLMLCAVVGCSNTRILEPTEGPQNQEKEIIYKEGSYTPRAAIYFQVLSDYPAGNVRPDRVTMNDQLVIFEGEKVPLGNHIFSIEKKGYETARVPLNVVDPDEDGKFDLVAMIKARERIIRFNITDETSGDLIEPDQVSVVSLTDNDSEQKVIGDHSQLKPGRYIIAVQKQGYKSINLTVDIDPEEEPFVLEGAMSPQ